MKIKMSRRFFVLLSCIVMGAAAEGIGRPGNGADGAQTRTNPDAQIMVDFKQRIDKYMELHNKLKREVPPLKETKDAAKIEAAQDGLADKIRAARKDAKPGEIFTPEIKDHLRRLMSPETKGVEGAQTKEALKEDAPKSIPIRVNAKYPEAAALPTMPPNLLAALPKLPEELEYRIINKDLILRDVQANVIVDYIQNAIR